MKRAYMLQWLKTSGRTYWPYFLAGLCLIAGIAFYVLAYRPLALETRVFKDRLKTVERQSNQHEHERVARRAAPQARLNGFYQMLPVETELSQRLGLLYQAAQKAEVSLPSGEYKLQGNPALPMRQYVIRFPVEGSYNHIRGFINQALADNPMLALDAASFSRDSVGADKIQANLRFTLFVRGERVE